MMTSPIRSAVEAMPLSDESSHVRMRSSEAPRRSIIRRRAGLHVRITDGIRGSRVLPMSQECFLLVTRVKGEVVQATRDMLVIDSGRNYRKLIARASTELGLEALLGLRLSVQHRLEIEPMKKVTTDFTIRDTAGDLLLWARDGRPPTMPRGKLLIQSADNEAEPSMLMAGVGGLQRISQGVTTKVQTEDGSYLASALRVDTGDLAFSVRRPVASLRRAATA